MNFIEAITKELGCCIAEKLSLEHDFGIVASEITDKDNNTFYVHEEKKIQVSDLEPYQAFHIPRGEIVPSRTQSPFPSSKSIELTAPMTFILLGWTGKGHSSNWSIIDCFSDKQYFHREYERDLVSAEIEFVGMESRPSKVVGKYFKGIWPDVAHKQESMIALEIKYLMKASTCAYCFE